MLGRYTTGPRSSLPIVSQLRRLGQTRLDKRRLGLVHPEAPVRYRRAAEDAKVAERRPGHSESCRCSRHGDRVDVTGQLLLQIGDDRLELRLIARRSALGNQRVDFRIARLVALAARVEAEE